MSSNRTSSGFFDDLSVRRNAREAALLAVTSKRETDRSAGEARKAAFLREAHRRRNRLYMRRWRSDPRHRSRAREENKQWYLNRKLREAQEPTRRHCTERGEPTCGFCHRRPPVGPVTRLRVSNDPRKGFVEVQVPYCGIC